MKSGSSLTLLSEFSDNPPLSLYHTLVLLSYTNLGYFSHEKRAIFAIALPDRDERFSIAQTGYTIQANISPRWAIGSARHPLGRWAGSSLGAVLQRRQARFSRARRNLIYPFRSQVVQKSASILCGECMPGDSFHLLHQ